MSSVHRQHSRKFAVIVTVLALLLGLFPVAAFASHGQFPDVSGVLAGEIKAAHDAGLVDGYDDGTFRPNENVTRAAFAKFIVLAVEKATGQSLPTGDEPFSDVAPNQALYEYVVKAYKAGYIQGYSDGTFGYDKPINRQEAAAILQRALKLADAPENFADVPDDSAFAKAIGAVAAAGLMKGYDNGNFGPSDKVNRAQAAAVAVRGYNHLAQQNVQYEVVSVAAVSSKALRVTFNKAVDDTSKVKFDVKRDGVAVDLTAKWAEDKKSVDLESSSKLQVGTYTVTVSGLDFAEGKNSGSVKVEEETVAKIEIVGDKLIRDKNTPSVARIGYKVYNQYGEDITNSSVAAGIEAKSSAGSASITSTGVVEITNNPSNQAWPLDAKVVLTLVHSATGVTASKTLTVADSGQLTSFAFGNIIYPDDSKRIYTGRSEAAWIEVQATDANGQPADEAYLRNAVTLVPQSGLQADFATRDGKPVIKIDTTSIVTAGKYTLTAVVLSSPDLNKSITLDVVKEPYPAKVELSAPEGLVAARDAAGTVVLGLKVYDQFGNEMAGKDVAAHSADIEVRAVGAGFASGANVDVFGIATTGANIGKVVNTDVIPALASGNAGTITVFATAKETGNTSTVQFQVRPEREPAAVVLPTDAVTNLLYNASSVVSLNFKDQYEANYDPAKADPAGAVQSFGYKVTLSGQDVVTVTVGGVTLDLGAAPAVSEAAKNGTAGTPATSVLVDLKNITLQAKSASGNATVTVQLLKGSNVVSSVQFNVSVAAPSSTLQYSLAQIPALYWDADGDPTNNSGTTNGGSATAAYAEEIRVVAKDSTGKTYTVAPSTIVVATVDGADFETGKDGNVWKVWSTRTQRPTDKVTGTLTVQVQTTDAGLVTLTGTVTISNEDRYAVNVLVRDAGLTSPNGSVSLPANSNPVSEATYDTAATPPSLTPKPYVAVEDQFGRYWVPGNLKLAPANVSLGVTVTDVSYAATGEVTVSASGAGTFDVVIQAPNGKTATIKVNVR
ncbi:S-layer domain-containing protein [Thermaerobacter marianensis DSM 12885]|uniref:S-layer domain-containing protein n=1 Tax=Thermaerobacter marianensis (strain ATCC 700841 / DSM 12885 / JCM 10246 / 7p75a) TaxID=644966 RepID=E6SG48_THEM7|nr:S-layer homology domain-containing protein [Thermaerobacter marianensis]ADU50465.1 S-layer domain-containing protein [Thermaerobacter marianensis DSM 12885]